MIPNTLTLLPARHAASTPGKAALAAQDGQDKWYDISWLELEQQIQAAAKALCSLGIGPADCVATYSANRPENIVTDFACYRNRAVSVSIYATSSVEQVAYIVNDAGCKVLIAGNATQYAAARRAMEMCPCLRRIIVIKPIELEPGDETTMLWSEMMEMASRLDPGVERTVASRTAQATPADLATLVYTSGTTGEPKGAMLTHANYDAALEAHRSRLPMLTPQDVSMAFLPLSHIFEKGFTYVCLMLGVKVAVNRDPRAIQDTLKEVRPTCMCSVPRFWEKVYTAVREKIDTMPAPKRAMVKLALKVGRRYNIGYRRRGLKPPFWLERSYRLFDARVFATLRGAIGIDRPNMFPTAGAPVSDEIVEFFHSCGLWLMVGYGLSETTATVTCYPVTGYRIGSVGTPIPGVQIRIQGPDNEVQVKSPTVMAGYYNKPAETAAAFTPDGWLRTGDAGRIDPADGSLWLTDRIKDLFKTSNGKYIAPQAIETPLGSDKYIEQVAVIGDGRKYVTALIVPEFSSLEAWARDKGLSWTGREALVAMPQVKDFYTQLIGRLQAHQAPFEKIKRFTLLPEPFSMDTGELTNTLKLKRRVITQRYAPLIEAMYGA